MTSEDRLKLLNQVLRNARNSAFYRDRIPEHPLRSWDELRQLPFTTKEDLRRQSPFGLLCVPLSEVYQYHESFGTTGTPVSIWLTKDDALRNAERKGYGVNWTENDIVLIRFPYAISAAAHSFHAAAQLRNACVIPASSRSTVTPFPRVINTLRRLRVTVLASLPLQALLLAETAELMGLDPAEDFPDLRAICTAGEPLTAARRKLLETIWGVPLFDTFGMTEIGAAAFDCSYGRTHPQKDDVVFEILDKELKQPAAPGEIGYLVITTLQRRATPLIRYVTGDRARLIPEKCPCGAETRVELHGRDTDTITVKGRTFDIWDFEEIVGQLPCQRFWVVGPMESGLHFVVEREKTDDAIPASLRQTLENKYGIDLEIELVPKGTLYDRSKLLDVGVVGKPRYVYSTVEMKQQAYLCSPRD